MKNEQIDSINWEQEFPEVPMCVHRSVERVNSRIMEKEKVRRISRKAIWVFAACFILLTGTTAFAANSLWQQRMEALNEQEMLEYFQTITKSNAPAFRYNRQMTEKELIRFGELESAYEMEGVFPEGMLTMISEEETYAGKGVGYETKSGTFFLPEETLSDEQILQIIDFYHKLDYSFSTVSSLVESGEISFTEEKSSVEDINPVMMQEFTAINENVSYLEVPLMNTSLPREIAADTDYVYLGYDEEIKRMAVGSDEVEPFYLLQAGETLFAMDTDREGHIFLSLRVYEKEANSYSNKLIKLDNRGQILVEYDVKNAVSEEGKKLDALMAYKMVEDSEGRLYVKTRWEEKLLLFVFSEDGTYLDAIYDKKYESHPANEMCFGEDGYLYVLGREIIQVDSTSFMVSKAFSYATKDMIAAADLLYPIEEDSFYLFGYDGVFRITLGEEASEKILAPYEKDIFEEGARSYAISKDMLVVVNYKEWGITITYLTF